MRRLDKISLDEFSKFVEQYDELSQKLSNLIEEQEMDFVEEKLVCIRESLGNWSIGAYNRNFMHVKDYAKFSYGVREMCDNFGLTTDAENTLKRLENEAKEIAEIEDLDEYDYATELWEKKVDSFSHKILEEEFNSITKFIEDVKYEIYNNDFDHYAADYMEYLQPLCDNYYVDENNNLYKLVS